MNKKDLIDYYFLFHGERMVVYKNGKQEALMPTANILMSLKVLT